MRIVYVAGFFTPVLTELQSKVKAHVDKKLVVWIPQFSNGDIDINRFKSSFFDSVAQGVAEVLVCLFVFRGREYLLDVLQAIIQEGQTRSPKLEVRIEQCKNARDAAWVVSRIEDFGPSAERAVPSDLKDLNTWIDERHQNKVFLHPRAVRAARKSQYGDAKLIYAAIDFLGNEYWDMKMAPKHRSSECRDRYTAKLQELGLQLSDSIAPSRAGEEGDAYFVEYPLGTGQRRMLDQHLTKGSDREERFCLRIYFFWDAGSDMVVVGWLPSHLDTRDT